MDACLAYDLPLYSHNAYSFEQALEFYQLTSGEYLEPKMLLPLIFLSLLNMFYPFYLSVVDNISEKYIIVIKNATCYNFFRNALNVYFRLGSLKRSRARSCSRDFLTSRANDDIENA